MRTNELRQPRHAIPEVREVLPIVTLSWAVTNPIFPAHSEEAWGRMRPIEDLDNLKELPILKAKQFLAESV